MFSFQKAPTFVDLGGYQVPEDMDGISLKSALLSEDDEAQVGRFY